MKTELTSDLLNKRLKIKRDNNLRVFGVWSGDLAVLPPHWWLWRCWVTSVLRWSSCPGRLTPWWRSDWILKNTHTHTHTHTAGNSKSHGSTAHSLIGLFRWWHVASSDWFIRRVQDHAALHTYTYTYIYIHTYIHTHIHTYIHTYTYTYIYIYIHTYIHTHIYIYI